MFRRQDSTEESKQVKLRGLEANSVYTLTDLDSAAAASLTGRQLMDEGLAITIKDRPGSALVTYEKKS